MLCHAFIDYNRYILQISRSINVNARNTYEIKLNAHIIYRKWNIFILRCNYIVSAWKNMSKNVYFVCVTAWWHIWRKCIHCEGCPLNECHRKLFRHPNLVARCEFLVASTFGRDFQICEHLNAYSRRKK